jgi:S-adenosyl-L-methionine hydrolase (adenosine-forming)
MNRLITLLSDFGTQDNYVGVMKAVIAQIAPATQVIDLTHQIAPQDIAAARFNLMTAYPYCPPGSVHVAVVDPGVGGARRAIAIALADGFLVGPDNGLFSGVLSQRQALEAVVLTEPRYWRSPTPSQTFHGRDIFAPIAAHLSAGVPFTQLGQSIDPATLVTLEIPPWQHDGEAIAGVVQYVDRFGNLVTTIPAERVPVEGWYIKLEETLIPGGSAYSAVRRGEAIALAGSHGWVEIAINGGNAHHQLAISVGHFVQLWAVPQSELHRAQS